MDNEISNSVHITISIIVISIVIGMVLLFTQLGQGFGRRSVDSVAAIQAETYASDLVQSAAYGSMPAASVYVMLQRNEHVIHSISGTAYAHTIAKADDLLSIFHKKIKLSIIEVNGSYDVLVGEE
ncbi:hypothetical protein [Paenibacillus sinopodophylli]|uniref:hypothetical protein n=1 Tax=Paenibacillus sinopodophylli TaxID=1837342 RepID=UPI00110CE630|nr:hypothetical protein [Paenibacillus sinopodophylli]